MNGVWTALITPFVPGGSEIDLAAFKKLLKDQKEAGVTGVIPCGTTGEAPTLTLDEKKLLIQTALKELQGSSVQVIAGTGSNDTADTVALSRWAASQKVAGVLLTTPYYNRPSQAGLAAHFRAVADAVDCEVMLYNVPGRSSVSIAPETVAELAAHPRIRSIKEASGNPALTCEIRDCLAVLGRSIDILSGDDASFLPSLAVGAVGVVSVASNLFPRAMVEIQARFQKNDLAGARAVHEQFYPLFRDLFVESNPVPIKAAMSYAGLGSPDVRLPLAPLSAASYRKLQDSMARCGVAAKQFDRGGL
jgi:4-hydroxy-tetrahydrodipicolinate synthase